MLLFFDQNRSGSSAGKYKSQRSLSFDKFQRGGGCYVAVCNNYAITQIATQFVIHRISNCVVMTTRFVMYYKLRQNFIILKYWKWEKKLINGKMHRFNHILLWIQSGTNLFELGMQKSQSTLQLFRTLFCPRTFAKTHLSVRLLVCLSVPLSVAKTLT